MIYQISGMGIRTEEDNYEAGCIGPMYSNYIELTVKDEDIQRAIITAFMQSGMEYNPENAEIYDNTFRYQDLVDEDNCQATIMEISEWKKGNKKLYNANITLFISAYEEKEIIWPENIRKEQ